MTEAQDRRRSIALAKRCERWAAHLSELGVASWRFSVKITDEIESDDNGRPVARINTPPYYDQATITFARWFLDDVWDKDWRKLDEVIVHEWLHASMRDLDEAIERCEDWFPAASYDLYSDNVNHQRERLVENLARLIVRLAPND